MILYNILWGWGLGIGDWGLGIGIIFEVKLNVKGNNKSMLQI